MVLPLTRVKIRFDECFLRYDTDAIRCAPACAASIFEAYCSGLYRQLYNVRSMGFLYTVS